MLSLNAKGLTTLTLLIAESDPEINDLMVRLTQNLIADSGKVRAARWKRPDAMSDQDCKALGTDELAAWFDEASRTGRVARIPLSPSQYARFIEFLNALIDADAQQRLQKCCLRHAPQQ